MAYSQFRHCCQLLKSAWTELVIVVVALKKHTDLQFTVRKVLKNVSVSVLNVSASALDPKSKVTVSSRSGENLGRSQSGSRLGLKIKSFGLISVSDCNVLFTSLLRRPTTAQRSTVNPGCYYKILARVEENKKGDNVRWSS